MGSKASRWLTICVSVVGVFAARPAAAMEAPCEAETLAGPSLLARRWFRPRAGAWRPDVQVGFGAVYTDAYRNRDQLQLGEALQFRTTVSVGFHARLARVWSWAGELSFNHRSDGGLSDRNYGVHALGMNLGLARSFQSVGLCALQSP
jgi:hypothetical protein